MIAPRLLSLVSLGWLRLLALTVGQLLVTASYVAQGVLIAQFLAMIFTRGPHSTGLWFLLAIVIAVALRSLVFRYIGTSGVELAADIKAAARQRLLDTILYASPGRLLIQDTGKVQTTLVDAIEKLDPYISRFLPQVWASAIGFLLICGYLIWLDPFVGGIVLSCGVLGPLVLWRARSYWSIYGRAWWARYHKMYSEILDVIRGMATLKAFNATRRQGEKLYEGAQAFCRESIRVNTAEGVFIGALSLLSGVGTAVAVGVGSLRLVGGHVSGTELLIILILTGEAFRPLQELNKAYHASYAAWQATRVLFESLDTEGPVVLRPAPPVNRPDALSESSAVNFEGIHFCYPDSDPRPALDDFSLELAPGERVAVVGRSGSGKSTLVSLLLRFFDPDSGRILIDGHDIRNMPLTELRARIAVVTQDTFLFHDTIRNNLLMARPSASEEDIGHALQVARAADFVAQCSLGLDTVVGERGMRLSGGQRQRLSIARAVLKNAPILVLDEATSSIDTVNEAEIQHALAALSAGRTTLVIAHRMSTVHDADHIAVVDSGRLLEAGTPHDLLAGRGIYHQLIDAEEAVR